jgi:2-polyprenyl-3-methyl-5-hydroxy-6-metoxy-1,4-benzoquinol methylase
MSTGQVQHLYGTGYTAAKANDTDTYLWEPVLHALSSLPRGASVLDAGCGNGYFAQKLHEKGFEVCGMDLEESGVVQARKLCPDVQFQVGSLYDDIGRLFKRQFDAVVSLEVIEHLYDPRRFVDKMHECLVPSGLFILSTPYHGYLKNLVIALTGKFDAHVSPLWDGGHIKFWSRESLTSLLVERGFKVTGFAGAGRFRYLWKSMVITAKRP